MNLPQMLHVWKIYLHLPQFKPNVGELSPKFNCCKMEYLFILRFKGPLRFSMFGTRLSFKQFWLCFFLTSSHHFGCRAPFWRPCTFACVSARLYSIGFRPAVAARPNFELEGLACFYDWKGGVSDFATSS